MVEAGLGLAAVPRLTLAPAPAHATLVGVELLAPAVSRVLGLATRRGADLHAPAKVFHDYLRAALKDRR